MEDTTKSKAPKTGDAKAIIDAAREGARPELLMTEEDGTKTYGWFHKGELTTERVRPNARPEHKKAHPEFHNLDSLARYVTDQAEKGSTETRIYLDGESRHIKAVINDFGLESGRRNHIATMRLQTTPEWDAWTGLQGFMAQTEFAEFIDTWLHTIATPAAADLVEIVETLEGDRSLSWRSGQRLSDGQKQFSWVEEIDGRAGAKGQLEIPTDLDMTMPVFVGAAPVSIKARFRYRLRAQDLRLGVKLLRVEEIEKEAILGVAKTLEGLVGDIPVLMGRP